MGLTKHKKSKKGKKKSKLGSVSSKPKKVSGKSGKKSKPTKSTKSKTLTRKDFILTEVRNAGTKGVKVESIVKRTNEKFQYAKSKSSRLRVGNTLRDAEHAGTVKVKNGVAYSKRG